MVEVLAHRYESSVQGTFSVWQIPEKGFSCHCLELPWYNNQRRISCIPTGDYLVKIRQSPKYGKIFHLQNVQNRSYILIHSGNFAGDVSKGYLSHSMGCLLLGKKRGWLKKQKAVLNSRIALRQFMNLLENKEFMLKIS